MPLAALSASGLIVGALAGAFYLSVPFAVALLAYLGLTLSYSFFLKRIPLVDVLAIASLFTLRIVAGMPLVGKPPSEWLLMFSIFFFFSLALMKREVELGVMGQTGAKVLQGRGYAIEDRTLLMCFGASSGVASLVVFALYVLLDGGATFVDLWGAAIPLGGHRGIELLDYADVALDCARPDE